MIKNFHQCNAYEQYLGDAVVFVSYRTPQAIKIDGDIYQCTAKYSRTTSKQVNRWIRETAHSNLYMITPDNFIELLTSKDYRGWFVFLQRQIRYNR